MAEQERKLGLSGPEWDELEQEAAEQSADRGREVTVDDVLRTAIREYVYRSRQRRKPPAT